MGVFNFGLSAALFHTSRLGLGGEGPENVQ